jgi:hypothetical protein
MMDNKPRRPRFAIGETVSQYSVLGVHHRDRNWRYRVVCLKCGHEREITQAALKDAERKQHRNCRACLNRKYRQTGLEYGEADRLRAWGDTDAMIAEHNRLMRQWPARAGRDGYWFWGDQLSCSHAQ